jgi:hypothetical protein
MKFVIWGAGYRGRLLLKTLGKSTIVAFVDKDEKKVGSSVDGIPIISTSKLMEEFKDFFIIISTVIWKEEIINYLESNDIYRYLEIDRATVEVQFYGGGLPYEEMIRKKHVEVDRQLALYGINVFSIMFYQYCEKIGVDVAFVECDEQKKIIREMKRMDDGTKFVTVSSAKGRNVLITDRYLDKTTNYFGDAINFYNFSLLSKYKYSKLDCFKNKYNGERCFIVGNGPSVRIEDLEKLYSNGELTFGVNSIYEVFKITKWRPTYYMVEDGPYCKKDYECFSEINVKAIFIGDVFQKNIIRDDVYYLHVFRDYYDLEGPDFSIDINKGVYHGGTILYNCIQVAAYMGFKKIYIIGADCEYKNNNQDYFFDCDVSEYPKLQMNMKNVFYAYRKAKMCLRERGVELYNATRGGKLEELDRVDFDRLFNNK